jgi:hypothetical protein
LTIFGAEKHKYKFNWKLSTSWITKFEKKHGITLPKDYREFLSNYGNGGCGPNFGLFKLEDGVLNIPKYPKDSEIINISAECRFENYWNLDFDKYENDEKWEEEYFNPKWVDGMLRISHQGCGRYVNLVITGKERGNIWVDNRVSDGGIYPVDSKKPKTDFITWYIDWIENSINEIKTNGNTV